MKKTLAARLVIGALASLAVGGAFAGQLTASSMNIAREAIATDEHKVTAPTISYRFSKDVDATGQEQHFQVQFTLSHGEWAVAPKVDAFRMTDINGVVQMQYTGAAYDTVTVADDFTRAVYSVTKIEVSADKKTVWANFRVYRGLNANITKPQISVNAQSNVVDNATIAYDNTIVPASAAVADADLGKIDKLHTTIVGNLVQDFNESGKCHDVKKMEVSVKHFKGLTNLDSIADGVTNGVEDESTDAGPHKAVFIVFPTNILVQVGKILGENDIIIKPGSNQTFTLRDGTVATRTATNAFVAPNTALLGGFNLKQLSTIGLDAGLTSPYLLSGGNPVVAPAGVHGEATAQTKFGPLELEKTTVTVKASNGFVEGGTVALYADANAHFCGRDIKGALAAGHGTLVASKATTAADTSVDVVIPTASINAAYGANGTGRVEVCYIVPGNKTIPSSSFSSVVRLNKSPHAGNENNEQDNICKGPHIGFTGGLKIDVRNYNSYEQFAAKKSQTVSYLRLINTSDNKQADVYAQIIHQDGKLGKWGKIADLPVRGVLTMSAKRIEEQLINAPDAGAGNNGDYAPAFVVGTGDDVDSAPRLRITSETGGTLRVQNYLYDSVKDQMWEASGSQGVDFEPSILRARDGEGEYISQDAQSGINLAP